MLQRFDKIPFSELIEGDCFLKTLPLRPTKARYVKTGPHSYDQYQPKDRSYNSLDPINKDVYFLRHNPDLVPKESSAPPVANGTEDKQ